MTVVPRLQNSFYRHQPKGKTEKLSKKTLETYSVVYKCLNSYNVESFYCCTNFDKSTLFKKVLKADNDEELCDSAGKLFHLYATGVSLAQPES